MELKDYDWNQGISIRILRVFHCYSVKSTCCLQFLLSDHNSIQLFFFCTEKNSSLFRHSLHLHIFPPRFQAERFPRFQAVSAFPALAIILLLMQPALDIILVPSSSPPLFPASLITLYIRMAHFSVGIIPFIRQWLLTPDYPKTITQQREFLSGVKTSTVF